MTNRLTPLSKFNDKYVPLYRALLVLGLLSALLSLNSIPSIQNYISHINTDIFYALGGLISILVVSPVMIASLILLYKVHPAGMRLRFAGYGLSIISASLGFFASKETLNAIVDRAVEAAEDASGGALAADAAHTVAETSYYVGIALTILISITFAALWAIAWKKQIAKDNKPTDS